MSTEDYLSQAKLAEIAERYDDMVQFMSKYFEEDGEVNDEARNLFSVAFKNKIGTRRAAWRSLAAEGSRTADPEKQCHVEAFKKRIENELTEIHKKVIDLIDDRLMTKATKDETKVFFQKMKGDYCRYKAEYTTGEERQKASTESKEAYDKATEIAVDLASTDATRLGLALNFSVFHYEIMNDSKTACAVAKKAFDDAIAHLDDIGDDKRYKDTTLIMQLLRDNLTLWSSDKQEADDDDDTKPEN